MSRDVIPFYLALAMLCGAAIALDALLHMFGMVWFGRYLGIPGVMLIIASSGYSMRKRKLISSGKPVSLLRWHERLAWVGSLFVRRQNIWLNSRLRLAECGPRLGVDVRRRACGVASADVRWSVA